MIKNWRFLIFTGILFLAGCTSSVNTPVKEPNFAKSYNPSSSKIHPSFTVYHDSEGSSQLFMKIFPKELLYSQANPEAIYKASLRVSYVLTNIGDTTRNNVVVADSGSIIYTFKREGVEQRFIASIKMVSEPQNLYLLKVTATDMIRKEEVIRYIYVDKRSNFSQQNFLVLDSLGKVPYFSPFVMGKNIFRLESKNVNDYDTIFVLYYGSEMPLPKPSFSTSREREFLQKPDSIWKLPFRRNLVYQLFYEGMYFFQLDTNLSEGLTLLNLGDDFPQIKTPEQLVDPLAYLTSSVEYTQMKNANNKKIMVDDFWLERGENLDRARELIRIYYNRVYLANYYFTTFKPGWKTDRGMIYIIYGPPQATYRSVDNEKWVYYRKNYSSSITFTFNYNQSPYTQDNFILQRSETYDYHWRQAVDSWKGGQVFMLD